MGSAPRSRNPRNDVGSEEGPNCEECKALAAGVCVAHAGRCEACAKFHCGASPAIANTSSTVKDGINQCTSTSACTSPHLAAPAKTPVPVAAKGTGGAHGGQRLESRSAIETQTCKIVQVGTLAVWALQRAYACLAHACRACCGLARAKHARAWKPDQGSRAEGRTVEASGAFALSAG